MSTATSATTAAPAPAPDNANEECVGPDSDMAGKASSCAGCPNAKACASGKNKSQPPPPGVVETMNKIGRTIMVLSGKGGVGKSTVSTQLALSLAHKGYRVGLLDLDICGPSVPTILGLKGQEVHQSASGWSPVYVDLEDAEGDGELGVLSIGFLMSDPDQAVIWRGPRKNGLIKQFFDSVDWGELDFLVIDTPPGTSDEHISIAQLLKTTLGPNDGAVVVSTPQEVAMADVRKELNFCKKTNIRVLGLVENMCRMELRVEDLNFEFVDRATGENLTSRVREAIKSAVPNADVAASFPVFPSASGKSSVEAMANAFSVPFLGSVPLDPSLQKVCDAGSAVISSVGASAAIGSIATSVSTGVPLPMCDA